MQIHRGVGIIILAAIFVLAGAPCARADEPSSIWERETFSDGFVGLADILAAQGISVSLEMTNTYQHLAHGGTRTGAGRYALSYDFGVELDMEELLGLRGGLMFLGAEGSRGDGLDDHALGSFGGINDDAAGDRDLDLTEFWYEQSFADGRAIVRFGKISVTGGFDCRECCVGFDCNSFADDETSQFLNSALVGNPLIPFPDNGLGVAFFVEPVEGCYAAFAVADAEADARETGINTTFDGDTYFFYVAEAGVVPMIEGSNGRMHGAYRLGVWHNRMPQDYLDGTDTMRTATGVYFSGDQVVWLENNTGDGQGLGLFARAGWADDRVSEAHAFWSFGASYRGLIPGRDADVLGLGWARTHLSGDASFTAGDESVIETFYNAEITPWAHIGPHVQWIDNPGGDRAADSAVVGGLRLQLSL